MSVLLTRALPTAAAALLLGAAMLPGRAWAQEPQDSVAVTVDVSLPAEAHSTPRDWYVEIADSSGNVVDGFTISTTTDAPAGSATRSLPAGSYTVVFPFNSQVAESCDGPAFFALAGPVGVTSSLNAVGSSMHTAYAFEACEGAPTSLGSVIQDTTQDSAPVSGASVSRAQNQAGAPLAPNTGTGLASGGGSPWAAPLTALGACILAAIAGGALVAHGYQTRR